MEALAQLVTDNSDEMYLRGSSHGEPLKVVLDTGATRTYISETRVQQLTLERRPVPSHKVQAAGGHTLDVNHQVQLPLTFYMSRGPWTRTITAFILPPQTADILLGRDTIHRLGLNFMANGSVTTKHGHQLLSWAVPHATISTRKTLSSRPHPRMALTCSWSRRLMELGASASITDN